jgi:Cyclin
VGGLPLAELNHLEIQFLILQDFNLMIPPAEIQFYADHLLHYWIMEQQRQAEKSFMGTPQPSTNLEYKSSGSYFPSTSYPSSSSSTVYPPHQPQYTQPMEDVTSTNTYSPQSRNQSKENQ